MLLLVLVALIWDCKGSKLKLNNDNATTRQLRGSNEMQASPWWDWECEVMLLMKKSPSKFQVANFGFFSWVVFPPLKSRVATFCLLLLGSPTKNITIVVTVTCQGDNPRYKGKHIPHHYQGAPHGRCRWKAGGVFLDIHLAAFGTVLKWLAFLVARNI